MQFGKTIAAQLGLLCCVSLLGCSEAKPTSKESGGKSPGSGDATVATTSGSGEKVKLHGSGASFPAPLYQKWFKDFTKSQPNVKVEYQSNGSGAGIKDLTNKTVDFAASDAAMTDEEMAKVEGGVVLFPMTAGKVVLAYNLPDVKTLKLSRDVYTKILLGKISKWSDAAIAKDNPGVKLPDMEITIVARADSSGTTYVFTQHLSAISEDWKNGPGVGKTIKWPESCKIINAQKNDGVTANIKQTEGSIGYIEYGFAKQVKLPMVELENKAGKFVAPTLESGQAALATVDMPEDMRAWIPDPTGDDSYPIVTYTWLLCYKKGDAVKSAALKELIKYSVTTGQKISGELGFIPLPESVSAKVIQALDNIQ